MKSDAVSPTVVQRTLMIQNQIVISGTLFQSFLAVACVGDAT
jgi:hypothetical protein